ncbi:MAG: TetR/AcrR family transcriptional regulator [Ignavibacteriales bacterium]|nr:TetR/AcrR family transcriptional regulator [Ignavibacteriales bacterium]
MALPNLAHEKEKHILDAAENRFARFGFSKVTMDEIAQDIGLAKASLYYYYPTKENIFRAVIARKQDKFLQNTKGILQHPDPAREKLKAYVRQRIALGNQLLNFSALNSTFWQESKPGFKDLFVTFSRQEMDMITTIVSEGKQNNEFEVASPEKTAELILHVLLGLRLRFLQATQAHGETREQIENFEQQVDFLIDTLLQGIVKRSSL